MNKTGHSTETIYIKPSQTVPENSETVSLIELKNLARKYLSPESFTRKVILKEPDYLTKEAAFSKIEVYLTLLYNELGFE